MFSAVHTELLTKRNCERKFITYIDLIFEPRHLQATAIESSPGSQLHNPVYSTNNEARLNIYSDFPFGTNDRLGQMHSVPERRNEGATEQEEDDDQDYQRLGDRGFEGLPV